MNIKFVINDYILVWTLLFQASVSEPIHKLKQKLWINYKNEYNSIYNDKYLILKEGKNFIPNDDTIYNIVMESKEYDKIKKSVEKYHLEIVKLWDNKTIKVNEQLNSIIKMSIEDCTIYVVDNELNLIDNNKMINKNIITLGKKIDKKNPMSLITDLSLEILKKEVKDYRAMGSSKLIADAIIDLAINNELATRISGSSTYFEGNPNLVYIKRQLYPYWLMYLGVKKEDMTSLMSRDKIAFDIDKFPYEEKLKVMNIEEFINFCILNKNHLVKEEQLEVI